MPFSKKRLCLFIYFFNESTLLFIYFFLMVDDVYLFNFYFFILFLNFTILY